tara:strand:- start:4050 stop:5414 length:1365 start_codon:yes stop_codon:yes gene_type:complete
MSLIPEIIIQRVLVNGIRELRNNPWKSDQLFRNVPQDFAQKFQHLLVSTSVDVTVNYPREDSQFPCIAILLRGEEENNILLGDLLGGGFTEDDGLFQNSSQFFFTPDEPSTSSELDADDLIGEPRKIFDSTENVYKERRGSGFSSSYMLQIMADNQDFTMFLYHAVRFIILSNIGTLERNGMFELRLSGTDFLPQPAHQPSFVFMRGLTMNFMYFAEHFVRFDNTDSNEPSVARSFVIDMELSDQLGTDQGEGTFAAIQSPHIESIKTGVEDAEYGSSISGSVGNTLTGNVIKGINFHVGFSLSIFDPITLSASDITLSNIKLSNDIKTTVFIANNTGQSTSTKLKYLATSTDTIPSGLLEGMVLRVVGPKTHDVYNEHRRIVSFTSGSGGSITVANEFSSSLSGAFVEVFKQETKVSFDAAVASDAAIGSRNVKITNADLKSSTLTSGFNVTS